MRDTVTQAELEFMGWIGGHMCLAQEHALRRNVPSDGLAEEVAKSAEELMAEYARRIRERISQGATVEPGSLAFDYVRNICVLWQARPGCVPTAARVPALRWWPESRAPRL